MLCRCHQKALSARAAPQCTVRSEHPGVASTRKETTGSGGPALAHRCGTIIEYSVTCHYANWPTRGTRWRAADTGCSPVEHPVGNMIDQMALELKVDYELDPVEFFAAQRLYGVYGPAAGFQRGTAGAQCRRRLDRGAFTLPNETSCLFQIGVPPRPCESVARARANSSGRVYTALIA